MRPHLLESSYYQPSRMGSSFQDRSDQRVASHQPKVRRQTMLVQSRSRSNAQASSLEYTGEAKRRSSESHRILSGSAICSDIRALFPLALALDELGYVSQHMHQMEIAIVYKDAAMPRLEFCVSPADAQEHRGGSFCTSCDYQKLLSTACVNFCHLPLRPRRSPHLHQPQAP